MCGLAGFIEYHGSQTSIDVLKQMQSVLRHRGPDDSGLFFEPGVGLAHVRLSIIDLSAQAHQPMRRGNHTLIYNGEIYNFRALRDELQSKGITFSSDSDTEVVLQAYRYWGFAAFEKFNGMFALAVYDHQRRELVVARDRTGVKPLVYFSDGRRFAFASEIKALLLYPEFRRKISSEGLYSYLCLGYTTGRQTIWENCQRLLPGEYLIVDGKTGRTNIRRYWEGHFRGTRRCSFTTAVGELQDILRDEFRQSLVSDVPVGACISGGVDSNVLAAILVRDHRVPLKTFSLGSRHARFDENRQAAAVAKALGTDHVSIELDPKGCRSLWEDTIRHFDEPMADQNILSLRVIAREARQRGIKVLLSGLGGDELFLGYPDAFLRARMPLLYRIPEVLRRNLPVGKFVRHNKIYKGLQLLQQTDALAASAGLTGRCFLNDEILKLAPDAVSEEAFRRTFGGWLRTEGTKGAAFGLSGIMEVDFKSYLTDNGLAISDISSMAEGVEMRVPYLNPAVIDFALDLSAKLKTHGRQTKAILRAVEARYLPSDILLSGKQGFYPFVKSHWLDNELRDYINHFLSEKYLRQQGIFDPAQVTNLLQFHQSSQVNVADKIWNLLVFQVWFDRHTSVSSKEQAGLAAVKDTAVL